MPSFNFKVDEFIILNFIFDNDFPTGESLFKIKFDDLQGYSYVQYFKIKLKDKGNSLERVTSPKLLKVNSSFEEV